MSKRLAKSIYDKKTKAPKFTRKIPDKLDTKSKMAGCGYIIYKKISGWRIFKFTSYKYFYELRDGHNNQPMYIDMNALCGFGGIVLLDYGIFKY